MKGTSSALIPVDGDEPLRSCIGRELVVASPAAALSPHFRLPDDWIVRKRRRRSNPQGKFDKYYYEPGTGRQFRSLRSIQKYLWEMKHGLLTSGTRTPGSEGRRSLHCSREMQIVTYSSRFNLPDGWIVEEKPRSNSYAGHIDKYYIEPGTGQRFRSLIAVQRYLAALDEYSTPLKALTSNQFTPSNSSDSSEEDFSDGDCSLQVIRNLIKAKKKLNSSRALKPTSPSTAKNVAVEKDKGSVSDSMRPPAKINWVLTGSGGNLFSPFIGDSMVPESVKQKWSEAFTLAVQD